MNTEFVAITLEEYRNLLCKSTKLSILTEAVSNDVSLNWDESGLSFSDRTIDTAVRFLFPVMHKNTMNRLKREKMEAEAND